MQKNIRNYDIKIVLLAAALLMLALPVCAQSGTILVDLTHAERVSIDGTTSPNLDTTDNNRTFNWTDWATYMRDEGCTVDVLTAGPITSGTLKDCDVLIIAEPDVTASGPAYFTADECGTIKTFVEDGGGLLLMGTQYVGGSTYQEFVDDYDTVYYYPQIHNALLDNLSVGMSFAEGMISTDPYDVMVDETDGIGGPKGNIWIHTGDKTHPIWNNVTNGTFAYWHGCSINVTDEGIVRVATGDDDTYTSAKNMGYLPKVKSEGSYPVSIAAAGYGAGKIVAYGDAGCWQGATPFGSSTFNNPDYHAQEIASNLIAYLCSGEDLMGDLNSDGELTSADALIALQMAVGSREPDIANGDMNGDGCVTSLDALMILQAAVSAAPSYSESEVYAQTTTDDTGYYIFENLPSGNYTVIAVKSSPYSPTGWTMGNVSATVGDSAVSNVNISVETADADAACEILNRTINPGGTGGGSMSGTVSVTILGGTVFQIAEATVLLIKEESGVTGKGVMSADVCVTALDAQSESYAETTSNETGYFEITGLEPGYYNLDASVTAANNPSPFDLLGQVEFELMPGEGRNDLFVVMGISANESASNAGNATSEEGKVCGHLQSLSPFTHTWSPISNGEVRVEKIAEDDDLPPEEAPVMPAPNTTTDTNGNFTFANLPAGNYTITALRESPYGIGIGNVTITIEAGECINDLEIWLNGSISSDLADATKNTTFASSGSSYGTGSISGRVLMCIPPGSPNVQPISSASVIITEYTGEGNLGSINKDPKIVFLLLSEGDMFLVKRAAESIGLNVSVYNNYRIPPDLNLTTYDVIFAERLVTKPLQDLIGPILDEAKKNNVSVICTHPVELSNVDLTEHSHILKYWESRCPENMERLLVYLGAEFCGLYGTIEEPVITLEEGIYHPDADRTFENLTEYLAWYGNDTGEHRVYDPNNYTVGITFWSERYKTGEIEIENKFIRVLEERGINVIAAYQPMVLYPPVYPPDSPCVNTTRIFMKDGEPAVDAIIDLGFGVYVLPVLVKNTRCLEMLDVPIINGIELYITIDEWRNGTTGKGFYFPYHIPIMEIAGQIESIVVGGREYDPVYDVFLLKPIDSQIDWAINRTISWIDLRYENNTEKNVAIIYYHHSVGKDSCLVAANLDVAPSIVNLLHAMNGSGYTLGEDIPDDGELLDLVLTQGRNIGMWVQEEINYVVENYDVALVSKEDYLEWFESLPEKKQNEVTERWGPPPGDIMVYKNDSGEFLVIPKITLGNILIAPQPSRAAEQNMTALYHDRSIPPTHQYIAFYYWLDHVYGADAIVSVGRHGTQEWLPGKGVGLSIDDCWPAILIQDMPVVYHYEVEGIGEGIMAKRRGNAVMIDHLTPVIVAAGLYGNLSNLEQTIPLYEREENDTLKMKYREQIIEMCRDLNLDQDLSIDLNETTTANETVFEEFLEEIHDYLLDIKREYMPYGLHIIGKQVSDDGLVDMTKSLLGYRFREYVERMNISENQTRMLIEEVIINGTSPEDAQKKILGTSENVTENVSENMTVLARTTADENGNYTFSNIGAGNYTIKAVKFLSPPGWWFIGSVNTSVGAGELLNDTDVWLTVGDETTANDILNATVDPGNLTGASSICGRALASGRYGDTVPMAGATVVISRQDSEEEVSDGESLTNYLNLAAVYADNLRECVIEIDRTLDALEGRYIIPGPSNDPIRNPDVLPTGRNFYGFDPNIVPTEPAWEVGCELIDQLLSQYCNETDECYPKKIGFVMFSFNTMKDLGVLESEIFYLLGVEPVWDKNGNVHDVRLIPTEKLKRPRIDVVVTMSGIYRENWPHQIELINKAVRIASEADDSPYHRNFVNESTESTYQWLIENNYTKSLAYDLSLVRIFGPPDGVWGVGGFITAIESSGSWENESKLADLYLRNMGYVYSDGIWGEQYVDLFSQNLNGTEVAIFAWSSHSHSVLGIDHTFEFFGGLSMAIRSITGEAPDMYINNLKDPGGAKLETLSQVITRDLRSMYYNPYWIEGMMEHGYAGAREMATIMANLWGWEVTSPDTITDAMWSEMYDVYVQDKYGMGLEGWFNQDNPWARQSIIARMIEATRKGYWDPSDEVKETLAEEYQGSVEEYGVTCCGHTCGNPFLDDYVSGMLPALTTDPPEQSHSSGGGTYPPDFMTTQKPSAPKSTTNETQAEDISAIPGGAKEIPVVEQPEEVVGQVIEKTEMKTDITFSGMELLGLVAVLLVLGLIYAGFRYKKR